MNEIFWEYRRNLEEFLPRNNRLEVSYEEFINKWVEVLKKGAPDWAVAIVWTSSEFPNSTFTEHLK